MQEKSRLFRQSIRFALKIVSFIWVIHLFKFFSGWKLGRLGIYPRTWEGLKGILTAPLIHGDFHHLISNSIPLLVLTFMISFFYRKVALKGFLLVYFLTGLSVWLFARQVYHIGASGVVYGLVSFVFWSGIFRRNIKSIVLALIVTLLYSGYLQGILPNQEGISWESHLFGALVGVLASFLLKNQVEPDEKPKPTTLIEEEKTHFFERDTIDKTKKEREKEQRNDDWVSTDTWKKYQ